MYINFDCSVPEFGACVPQRQTYWECLKRWEKIMCIRKEKIC